MAKCYYDWKNCRIELPLLSHFLRKIFSHPEPLPHFLLMVLEAIVLLQALNWIFLLAILYSPLLNVSEE
ncbi:hypothetical protein E2320_003219, partial [Naja naja]